MEEELIVIIFFNNRQRSQQKVITYDTSGTHTNIPNSEEDEFHEVIELSSCLKIGVVILAYGVILFAWWWCDESKPLA